jgi:EAL domain-containing protein (putative c-di-GMP-specific phosphodiesterase class I)
VAQGGTSLSAEVLSGVVAELATQLRREEIEEEADQALRGDIERFVSGHGVWMVFHPIVDLETRQEIGVEALARFGSIPMKPPDQWFAEATALELGLQLELRILKEALEALPKIPDGAFLSINCSHHAAASPEFVERLVGIEGRIVLEITEHEAIGTTVGSRRHSRPSESAASASPSTMSAPDTPVCVTRCSSRPTW